MLGKHIYNRFFRKSVGFYCICFIIIKMSSLENNDSQDFAEEIPYKARYSKTSMKVY